MRRLAAVLVAALIVAAVLVLVRDSDVAPEPQDDAGAMPTRAPEPDHATELDIAAKTIRGLPTPGCEKRARQRPEHSRELDVANIGLDAVAQLQQSGDTEHLLAAALMSTDRRELQELLDRVLIADPTNRVAHWKNLENCHALGSECDRPAVEAPVLAVDSVNGLVWIDVAGAHMSNEHWEAAEDALRRAAAAPRFDTYFMEYALLIERGLAATTELGYTDRMVAGIGFAAAAATPGFREMTRRCTGEADGYVIPADICFELGAQMARYGTEVLTVLIGKSVQRHAASRLGNERLSRELDSEKQQIRDAVLREGADSGAHVLLQNDAGVLRRYIETFVAHGEIHATEALVAEARRLREDPDYDQCNFVGRPDFAP